MGSLKGFLEGSVYPLTRKYLLYLLIPLMFLNDNDGRNINLQREISRKMGLRIRAFYLGQTEAVVKKHREDIEQILKFGNHKELTNIVKEARDALENHFKDYCPEITEVFDGNKKEQYRRVTFISLDGNAINKDNIPTEGFKKRARDVLASFGQGASATSISVDSLRDFFENSYPYIESKRTSDGEHIYLAAAYTESFKVCSACHTKNFDGAIIFPIYSNKLNELEKILAIKQ